jgi:predicted nuclease of predicted toxin-antitoxin system
MSTAKIQRFLIDNNLPPRFAIELTTAGYDAVHIRDRASPHIADERVFEITENEARIVVAQDTDFGTLLATRKALRPSVILFRMRHKSVDQLLPILLANIESIEHDLATGCIAVFDDTRLRVRRLPM